MKQILILRINLLQTSLVLFFEDYLHQIEKTPDFFTHYLRLNPKNSRNTTTLLNKIVVHFHVK